MTPATVRLHLILPGEIPPETAVECLSCPELARAARFHFAADREAWIGWRAGLRRILAREIQCAPKDVPLGISEFGKPLLLPPHDGLHFNLSHCHGLALVALCIDGPVGVDLEPLARADDLLGCEETFCHPEEVGRLPASAALRASELLRIWTAKEAVLKALGTGLSFPPEALRLVSDETGARAIADRHLEGLSGQRLHVLRHAPLIGFQAVVSSPASTGKIEWA